MLSIYSIENILYCSIFIPLFFNFRVSSSFGSFQTMLRNFQYCPLNVTVDDFWWNYGVSNCLLDTIRSLALAGFIVTFGSIEILVYRKYATPIEDMSQLPASKLYHVQKLLLTLTSFSSFLKYALESYLSPDPQIYGYSVEL